MPQLIRQRKVVADDWRSIDDDPTGRERALIIPFARWQAERDQWWLWDGKLGVRIGPTDSVDALELAMAIRRQYGVSFNAEDEANKAVFKSLRSLAEFVRKAKASS